MITQKEDNVIGEEKNKIRKESNTPRRRKEKQEETKGITGESGPE